MAVIEIYMKQLDWAKTRMVVLTENTLQHNSLKSTKRVFREIELRVSHLTPDELQFLYESDKESQIGMLWIAICEQYRIIYEFVSEVIPSKIVLLDNKLRYSDFERFYESKSEDNDELTNFADSTLKRAKSNLFRMLKQVGILEKEKIIPMILTPRLGEFVRNRDIKLLKLFPLVNGEIKRWIND
jgi:hypothetical protein